MNRALPGGKCPKDRAKLTVILADGVGFEPTRGLHPWRFSRPLPSTARPPIQPQNSATRRRTDRGQPGAIGTRLAPEDLSRLADARQGRIDGVGRLGIALAEEVCIDAERDVGRGVTEPTADRYDIHAG